MKEKRKLIFIILLITIVVEIGNCIIIFKYNKKYQMVIHYYLNYSKKILI